MQNGKHRILASTVPGFLLVILFVWGTPGSFAYQTQVTPSDGINQSVTNPVVGNNELSTNGTGLELRISDDPVATTGTSNLTGPRLSPTGGENNDPFKSLRETSAPSYTKNCSPIDVTAANWSWDDVSKQTQDAVKADTVPQWLGCLIGKTHIPDSHVYDKLADMPPVLGPNISHRGIKMSQTGDGWAVGFPAAIGPVCRIVQTPGGSYAGEYMPDGRCLSVIWVSETPGGDPLCYTQPIGAVGDATNGLEITPSGQANRGIWSEVCDKLTMGKRYYCNFTAVGMGEVRPKPDAQCNYGVVSPMTQTVDPD